MTLTVLSAEVKSQDAVYVLAYSIIMLNTDLHNPQIRVWDQSVSSDADLILAAETYDHRGLHAEPERRERRHRLLNRISGNVTRWEKEPTRSPAHQLDIYESIRKCEIVMPEEHTGQLGFEYAWKELVSRTRQAGVFLLSSYLYPCSSALREVHDV